MIGLKHRNVLVTTKTTIKDGDPFGHNVETGTIELDCIASVLEPSMDGVTGDAESSVSRVNLFVFEPSEVSVNPGDTFVMGGRLYTVNTTNAGYPQENMSPHLPVKWSLTARARQAHG